MITEELHVEGMTCSHCVQAVTREVGGIEGVASVAVDLATGVVTVVSEARLDPVALAAAVDDAGYVVVP